MERQVSQEQDRDRAIRDRTERLRRRLKDVSDMRTLIGLVKGILDLLADEL